MNKLCTYFGEIFLWNFVVCTYIVVMSCCVCSFHPPEKMNIKVVQPNMGGLPSQAEKEKIQKAQEENRQFLGIPRKYVTYSPKYVVDLNTNHAFTSHWRCISTEDVLFCRHLSFSTASIQVSIDRASVIRALPQTICRNCPKPLVDNFTQKLG